MQRRNERKREESKKKKIEGISQRRNFTTQSQEHSQTATAQIQGNAFEATQPRQNESIRMTPSVQGASNNSWCPKSPFSYPSSNQDQVYNPYSNKDFPSYPSSNQDQVYNPCGNKDFPSYPSSNKDQVLNPCVPVVTRNPSNSRGSQDQASVLVVARILPAILVVARITSAIFVVTRIQYTSLCGNKDLASSPCGNKEPGTNPCGNKDSTHQVLR
ncbi:hypothetical protein ACLKA6_016427 [Drosophila palustris]